MTSQGKVGAATRLGLEAVLLVAAWGGLMNLICNNVYKAPKNFHNTLGLMALILASSGFSQLFRRLPLLARLRRLALAPLLGGILIFAWWQAYTFHEQVTAPRNLTRLVDVGQNTYEAGKMFFHGRINPYAYRGQIWHVLEKGPYISHRDGQTHLFNIPYKYGYPYFPWMFFSYDLFRPIVENYHSIRYANLLFLLVNIILACLLVRRLALVEDRWVATLAVVAAMLSAKKLGFQLFSYGVTDLVIGCYLLGGILAQHHGRDAMAGVLYGMAQASKLFPGALMLPVAYFWYQDPRRRLRFMLACGAFVALAVGPFFLWDPQAFITATILFYMAHHGDGDDSSYYWKISKKWKGAFTTVRWPLIALTIYLGFRRGDQDTRRLLLVSSLCYLLFLAFNKMLHLNYYWPTYGISVLALLGRALPRRREPVQLELPGIK